MIKHLNSSISVLLVLSALAFGCSNDEQVKEQERQARQEQAQKQDAEREAQRQAQRKADAEAQAAVILATPSEPEKPAEPEYKDVDVYIFTPTKGKQVSCETSTTDACGASFTDCDNGMAYVCMRDVEYRTSTKKKLVE